MLRKSEPPDRYTLSPFYVPDRVDGQDEWTDAHELQLGVWEMIRNAPSRSVNLEHLPNITAGERLDFMSWPYAHEAELLLPQSDGTVTRKSETFPPGTAYIGIVWEPWAWEWVEKGWLRGVSMEGRTHFATASFEGAPTPTSTG